MSFGAASNFLKENKMKITGEITDIINIPPYVIETCEMCGQAANLLVIASNFSYYVCTTDANRMVQIGKITDYIKMKEN